MKCPKDKCEEYPNCKHRLGRTVHLDTGEIISKDEHCELDKCQPKETKPL